MSEWENNQGESDEWYTPPEIFAALDERFDLDPCQPAHGRAFLSVPADRFYTPAEDGLAQPWHGFVFMNPPFGKRNGQVPWLQKFMAHGNGIALVRAYTSAGWFHDEAVKADAMLFPRGKTKFVRPDGTIGKAPGAGVVLLGRGARAVTALERSGLGLCVKLPPRKCRTDGRCQQAIEYGTEGLAVCPTGRCCMPLGLPNCTQPNTCNWPQCACIPTKESK